MRTALLIILAGFCLATVPIPPTFPAAAEAGEPAEPAPMTVSDAELAQIVGGDSCYNCHYDGRRLDECYHSGLFDSCQSTKCIANYAIESTCEPGTGTCTAYQDAASAWLVQYVRADTGCTTSQPTGWSVWFTHYYGSGCTSTAPYIRCTKNNGECNGTLISSSSRYPGIVCP